MSVGAGLAIASAASCCRSASVLRRQARRPVSERDRRLSAVDDERTYQRADRRAGERQLSAAGQTMPDAHAPTGAGDGGRAAPTTS